MSAFRYLITWAQIPHIPIVPDRDQQPNQTTAQLQHEGPKTYVRRDRHGPQAWKAISTAFQVP